MRESHQKTVSGHRLTLDLLSPAAEEASIHYIARLSSALNDANKQIKMLTLDFNYLHDLENELTRLKAEITHLKRV